MMRSTLLVGAVLFALGCKPPHYVCGPDCVHAQSAPRIPWRSIATIPKASGGFTEGLAFGSGRLYESSGRNGKSHIFELDPRDGHVIRDVAWASTLGRDAPAFAEGLSATGDRLIQLSWKDHVAEVWSLDLRLLGEVAYTRQGWGLATLGDELYRSDGTATIHVHAPGAFCELRAFQVRASGEPVANLNELEAVGDDLFANVWYTPLVVRIDPHTGAVTGVLDLQPLVDREAASGYESVLNGLAYAPATKQLYVTGKQWKHIYIISLEP